MPEAVQKAYVPFFDTHENRQHCSEILSFNLIICWYVFSTSPPDEDDVPPPPLPTTRPSQVLSIIWPWVPTAADQVSNSDMESSEANDGCLPFWLCNSVGLNKLFLPALHASSVLGIQLWSWTSFQPGRPNIAPSESECGSSLTDYRGI